MLYECNISPCCLRARSTHSSLKLIAVLDRLNIYRLPQQREPAQPARRLLHVADRSCHSSLNLKEVMILKKIKTQGTSSVAQAPQHRNMTRIKKASNNSRLIIMPDGNDRRQQPKWRSLCDDDDGKTEDKAGSLCPARVTLFWSCFEGCHSRVIDSQVYNNHVATFMHNHKETTLCKYIRNGKNRIKRRNVSSRIKDNSYVHTLQKNKAKNKTTEITKKKRHEGEL